MKIQHKKMFGYNRCAPDEFKQPTEMSGPLNVEKILSETRVSVRVFLLFFFKYVLVHCDVIS